jgi:hypothetical protein
MAWKLISDEAISRPSGPKKSGLGLRLLGSVESLPDYSSCFRQNQWACKPVTKCTLHGWHLVNSWVNFSFESPGLIHFAWRKLGLYFLRLHYFDGIWRISLVWFLKKYWSENISIKSVMTIASYEDSPKFVRLFCSSSSVEKLPPIISRKVFKSLNSAELGSSCADRLCD